VVEEALEDAENGFSSYFRAALLLGFNPVYLL